MSPSDHRKNLQLTCNDHLIIIRKKHSVSNASVAVVISYLSIRNEKYRICIHDPMESRNSTPNGRVEKHFNLREVTVLKRNSQFKAPLFPVLPMLISF